MQIYKSEYKQNNFVIICKNCKSDDVTIKIKETKTNAVIDLFCSFCKSVERIY